MSTLSETQYFEGRGYSGIARLWRRSRAERTWYSRERTVDRYTTLQEALGTDAYYFKLHGRVIAVCRPDGIEIDTNGMYVPLVVKRLDKLLRVANTGMQVRDRLWYIVRTATSDGAVYDENSRPIVAYYRPGTVVGYDGTVISPSPHTHGTETPAETAEQRVTRAQQIEANNNATQAQIRRDRDDLERLRFDLEQRAYQIAQSERYALLESALRVAPARDDGTVICPQCATTQEAPRAGGLLACLSCGHLLRVDAPPPPPPQAEIVSVNGIPAAEIDPASLTALRWSHSAPPESQPSPPTIGATYDFSATLSRIVNESSYGFVAPILGGQPVPSADPGDVPF